MLNDITCRDWQYRTLEWLQGKNWESTTPVGPYLVTPDELPGGVRPSLAITTVVDGETMQQDDTADLLFDPVALVEYVSTMVTLRPGDIIATGTPGGVGHARKPARYLRPGSTWSPRSRAWAAARTVVADGRADDPHPRRRAAVGREGTEIFLAVLASLADDGRPGPPPCRVDRQAPGRPRRRQRRRAAQPRPLGRTGEETPMYSSPEQRDADIEAGATRPAAELRDWVAPAPRRSRRTSALDDEQWARQVRTAQGRTVPATEIPWMRAREVMVHAVDLEAGCPSPTCLRTS